MRMIFLTATLTSYPTFRHLFKQELRFRLVATGRITTVTTHRAFLSTPRTPRTAARTPHAPLSHTSTTTTLVQSGRAFATTASRPSVSALLASLQELAKQHGADDQTRATKKPPTSPRQRERPVFGRKTLRALSGSDRKQAPRERIVLLDHEHGGNLSRDHQHQHQHQHQLDHTRPHDGRLAAGGMSSSIEFITTPTADTPGTTLILRTQTHKHYVFGSQAEGIQRALVQQGTRLLKVQDFFLTGKTEWSNVGGMAGMMLTMTDSTSTSYAQALATWEKAQGRGRIGDPPVKPHFNIYGPPNLKHMLGTCRRFIFRKGVPIIATEYTDRTSPKRTDGTHLPAYEDGFLQVWALPVTPRPKETDAQAEAKAEAELEHEIRRWELSGNTFEDHQAPGNESPEDRHARHDRIRTLTVKHMFDSSWSFDTLVERHISEVEMPAAMFVRNPDAHGYRPYTGPKPGGAEPLPDVTVWTRTPWPGAKIMSLPPTKPAPESISYIVRTYPARGSFDVKRAKELGVKPGPDFGKLSNGQSVQNANGDTITPDQVLGPDRPGQGFALLDIPSIDYLEAVVQRDEFQSANLMKGIEAFIWTLGPGVAGHAVLNEFIAKFDKIKHIISSADISPNRVAFDSVAAQTTRLAQVDPTRYRTPQYDLRSLPQKTLSENVPIQQSVNLTKGIVVADRGLTATLMPKFELKTDTPPAYFDPESVKKETAPEVLELAVAAQKAVRDCQNHYEPWRALLAHPDTEITTLGTGSALPSKYRNVSATLVRVPGVGNYLFDAGENTMGQLQRVFPPDELVQILKELRVIWISHLHADHHLGTASVIRAWYHIKHNNVPNTLLPVAATAASDFNKFGLAVISHDGMLQWLREYASVEDFGYSRILPLEISPVTVGVGGSLLSIKGIDKLGELRIAKQDYAPLFGFADIQSVKVAHCHGAMAVSITFPRSSLEPNVKPLKVSYSGDCRPSQPFSKIGRDTTVLIHEATFDDELEGDARAKKHSTTSEALGIGASMNAKAVVLTHFSQRYQKIPVLQPVQDGEASSTEKDTSAATIEDVDDIDPSVDTTLQNPDIRPPPSGSAVPQPPKLVKQSTSLLDNERVIKLKNKDMKVAIAFDYMRVKLQDIIELEKYNEALNELLVKEVEEELGERKEINTNGKRNSEDEQGRETSKKQKNKEKHGKKSNKDPS
ncbi:oxidoreductase [Ascochyta rabiei]|uniref:ribonuclease Z n=1 Tax=Didymella rabiei TaxID=5454 RepID=A0A163LTK5_DIDRA|nr:oxidoreductase [Ascochyta rabiei]